MESTGNWWSVFFDALKRRAMVNNAVPGVSLL